MAARPLPGDNDPEALNGGVRVRPNNWKHTNLFLARAVADLVSRWGDEHSHSHGDIARRFSIHDGAGRHKVVLPDSQRFADTGRDFLLETTIPGDFKTLEGIVWGLLTLSSQCPDKDFSAPFFPDTISSTSQREGAQPLYVYFRGLRQDGRKVVLRFTGDAYRYLNNTAAIQELVKGALEATIRLHTNKSTTIDYEIDGKIVDEWDA